MGFDEIFEHLKELTKKDILVNGVKDTPPSFSLEEMDVYFELDADSREHILQGVQPIGKINRTAYDIALTKTEYDKVADSAASSKKLGDAMKSLIRTELDKALKEHGLIDKNSSMSDISTKLLQKLYSLSVQPEVNFTISVKSISENIGCSYEIADNTLVELERARYIDTFRSSHDVARLFGIRLTKKGFDYCVAQGWVN